MRRLMNAVSIKNIPTRAKLEGAFTSTTEVEHGLEVVQNSTSLKDAKEPDSLASLSRMNTILSKVPVNRSPIAMLLTIIFSLPVMTPAFRMAEERS